MIGHEDKVNAALRRIGEGFREGLYGVDEYRARRRQLIEHWTDADITTSPEVTRPRAASATVTNATQGIGPAATKSRAGWIAAAVVLLLAAGGALYGWTRSPAPAAPAVVPAPAIVKTAEEFLARNRWESGDVAGFLEAWRSLDESEQKRARQAPALRALRIEAAENLRLQEQLGDAEPERQEHIERLRAMTAELADAPVPR